MDTRTSLECRLDETAAAAAAVVVAAADGRPTRPSLTSSASNSPSLERLGNEAGEKGTVEAASGLLRLC